MVKNSEIFRIFGRPANLRRLRVRHQRGEDAEQVCNFFVLLFSEPDAAAKVCLASGHLKHVEKETAQKCGGNVDETRGKGNLFSEPDAAAKVRLASGH